MSDEFAEVYSSWSVEDVHLARIRLADEGIEGHLANDQAIATDWFLANSMQGVKLLVREADAVRARAILSSEPVDDLRDTSPSDGPQEWAINGADRDGSDESPASFADQTGDSDHESHGTLSRFRSFKRPFVLILLIPTLFGILMQICVLISSIFLRHDSIWEILDMGW